MEGNSTAAKQFYKEIRSYNTVISMASASRNWFRTVEGDSMLNPTMTLQGRIHLHSVGLLPPVGQTSALLSVYIFNSDLYRQIETRVRVIENLDREVLIKRNY